MRGPRLRAADAGANPAVRPPDLPGELAVRLRVLRRARRDAQTRASRVRRVLLAPTASAGTGETFTQTSNPQHRN
ncbi:hypothetical protein [Actinomadura sp. 9N215]|uniref:hypothetical protein n=1 Tax=Actinomadura sp. 9N215 TaxID=3375150 RepID=UPI0037BE9084